MTKAQESPKLKTAPSKSRLSALLCGLLGGRPMKFDGYAFRDIVDGQQVYYYRDGYGRRWMANGQWSLFRVVAKETT